MRKGRWDIWGLQCEGGWVAVGVFSGGGSLVGACQSPSRPMMRSGYRGHMVLSSWHLVALALPDRGGGSRLTVVSPLWCWGGLWDEGECKGVYAVGVLLLVCYRAKRCPVRVLCGGGRTTPGLGIVGPKGLEGCRGYTSGGGPHGNWTCFRGRCCWVGVGRVSWQDA